MWLYFSTPYILKRGNHYFLPYCMVFLYIITTQWALFISIWEYCHLRKHQCWSSLNQCFFICFLFFADSADTYMYFNVASLKFSFNHLNTHYIRYIIALFTSFLNPLCITMCKMGGELIILWLLWGRKMVTYTVSFSASSF